MSEYVLEVLFGFGDGEPFDCFCGLVGVFIVYSEVSGGGSGDYVMVVLPLDVAGFLEYVVLPIILIIDYFNIILAIITKLNTFEHNLNIAVPPFYQLN